MIKEDLEFTVKETDSGRIKEVPLSIPLGEKGIGNISTEQLNGYLKSVSVEIPVNMEFNLSMSAGMFKILSSNLTQNTIFFPKYLNCDEKGLPLEILSTHYSEFPLNDKLNITIRGVANSIVKVVIRYG
jgi:hypothetical protein